MGQALGLPKHATAHIRPREMESFSSVYENSTLVVVASSMTAGGVDRLAVRDARTCLGGPDRSVGLSVCLIDDRPL